MAPLSDIDIQEDSLRKKGDLLDILLKDRTSKKNIIWATDSYQYLGKKFATTQQIKPRLITAEYNSLIQPRAVKSLEEQRKRTREKAEVFTPLNIVDQIVKSADWSAGMKPNHLSDWKQYVTKRLLEVSCGEGPFIVSRYNPTSHTGKLITLSNRVGFLDRKLKVVSQNCHKPKEWLFWAKRAYQSSYGYEWQGDNLLIARENLLFTLIDYYKGKFGKNPSLKILTDFAEIISWNIFQMDGVKYVIPMSCEQKVVNLPSNMGLFEEASEGPQAQICIGCSTGNPEYHRGTYSKIMDWDEQKIVVFKDL